MPSKKWYLSRLAIIGIVAALVGAAGTIANIVAGQEVMDAGTVDTVVTFIGGLAIFFLRWRTNQPIT